MFTRSVRSSFVFSSIVACFPIVTTACASDNDPERAIPTEVEPATPASPAPDPTAAFFAADHLVEVSIEIAPEDWYTLSHEGRSLVDSFLKGAYPYEYTYFPGNITLDGVRYENVGLRKKGFFGSLSALKPSLKVDFDRYVDGQSHGGLMRLTLNNDRQDLSHTHQCLSYRLFAKAGLPASRCNLAHVVVNGEDLGTFTNVESIDDTFLARHFSDPSGNLYEGETADFVAGGVDKLELKTNKKLADRSDLAPVVAALEAPDADLVAALEKVVDLDSFRTFWAMEALVGHGDSYSGSANNYQVYHDPTTNRFYFFPWGTDNAFTRLTPITSSNTTITVFANGRLANRLYAIPEQRELYRQRLGELNEALWDETTLLAEVDQIAQMAPDADATELAKQRTVITSQKEQLRAALASPAPDWATGTTWGGQSPCFGLVTDIHGSFSTTWGDLMAAVPGAGQFSLDMSMDGNAFKGAWFGKAGIDMTGANAAIAFVGVLPDGRTVIVQLQVPPKLFKSGTVPFHCMESVGMVLGFQGQAMQFLGYISDGTMTFEQTGNQPDAPVVGSFQGRFLQFDCLNAAGSG